MKIRVSFAVTILTLLSQSSFATVYNPPIKLHDSVVAEYPNEIAVTRAEKNETLLDVARRFSLGQMEIIRLNQDLDRWLIKKDQIITLPNKRVLPDSPHIGITLNIAEYRMYYYSTDGKIYSFAHGVGRQDWNTPLGKTTIQKKVKDPVWRPPESIRREHAANGDPLPEVVPAGIHNPLGAYALYLNLPGDYRIHGTDIDKIFGIGMQITHGCVRMYPEDIDQLYHLVSEGTPVYIVKQPIKVGWLDNVLYIESHPDLEGEETTVEQRLASALALIQKANNYELPEFNQMALKEALEKQTGNPTEIYERTVSPEEAEVNEAILAVPKASIVEPAVKTIASSTNTKVAPKRQTASKVTEKSKVVVTKKTIVPTKAKVVTVVKPIGKLASKPVSSGYHKP
ncbi:MAG: L,D-transpeptidase family protein [Methylococcales bacterium]|nr:L,D-transpeptidase family protein [Methylococcales bacterium]MDD5753937.1 L,D-transpeptidase family protein [Methylococcales bacterium]